MTGEARVRVGHTMTAGEKQGEIWVMGGTMGAATQMDVQVLNVEKKSWSTPFVDGAPPDARSRHSANRIGSVIYVFGGGDNKRLFNDLWALDTEQLTWTPIATFGSAPSCRWGHTATLIDTRLFIFGGHDGANRLNDVHVLDTQTFLWSQPPCLPARTPPSPRSLSFSSGAIPSSNSSPHSHSSSLEEIDLKEFLPSSSSSPSPLSPSQCVDRGESAVVRGDGEQGGCTALRHSSGSSPSTSIPSLNLQSSPRNNATHLDALRFRESTTTTSTPTYKPDSARSPSPVPPLLSKNSPSSSSPSSLLDSSHILPIPDGIPPARAGHSANCLGRKLIIYGGGDGKLLGDMYYLNVDTFEWSVMESGNVPDRCAHTSEVVYTPGGSRLLVFGGSNGIKTFNDLYLVTCSKNRLRTTSQKRKSNSIIKGSTSTADGTPQTNSSSSSSPTSVSPSTSSLSINADPQSATNILTSSPGPSGEVTASNTTTTLSYKDIVSKDNAGKHQKDAVAKKEMKNSNSDISAPPAVNANESDPLYCTLKEGGLEKYYARFVEQEVSLLQIPSLNESHFQSLGITSIRDKALMAKLKENVIISSKNAKPNAFTAIAGPKQAIVMHFSPPIDDNASPASPLTPRSYAQAAKSLPQAKPLDSSTETTGSGATADLARKLQLSADALASASDSLRAAAAASRHAIRSEK